MWAQRKEVWNHLPCLCMPLQLAVQELPAVLQLFRTWAENAHLNELKQNCREGPAAEVIHQWEQCCSLPLQGELWALRSGWILSKALNPPFSFSLPVGDLSPVLPPAGPAGVKLHSSAPTEHSSGYLWLVLAFFYLNNSPALVLKLLSSALVVTSRHSSRHQFFVCTQHAELYTGTTGQS